MTTIPTIETERLILGGPTLAGMEAYMAFYAGPRSSFVGGPMTREQAWRSFASHFGCWSIRGYGPWLVRDQIDDTPYGVVGLWYPEGWPEPEISWTVFDAAEGKGVAHEAALRSRAYAYETLGWSTVISLIDPANARSLRLAERLGAVDDGGFEHERYGSMRVFRHRSAASLREGG